MATISEISQAFGIYFLGITFDFFDIVMFASGVAFAVLFDKLILAYCFKFWAESPKSN